MMEAAAKSRARRGTEVRKRCRRITYRITETEYAEVEAAASAAGLTLASYARARTVERPTTGTRRRVSVDVLALSRLLCAVNRMGGNLHQLVKHLNFGGFLEQGELRAALRGYDQMVAAIMTALGMLP
jgi:mobilization protein NikA